MRRKKNMLLLGAALSVLAATACGTAGKPPAPADFPAAGPEWEESSTPQAGEASRTVLPEENIAEISRIFYEETKDAGTSYGLETAARVVAALGESGYVAVDGNNQVDMEGADEVLEFCRMAEGEENAEVAILVVDGPDSFFAYELKCKGSNMTVTRTGYRLGVDGKFQAEGSTSYPADFWQYTQEGYLIWEGSPFSEEEFVLTLSNAPEHTAIRVLPLDSRLREYNREYVLPVGYGWNNLFLCSWSEEDYNGLDFYDLFDILCPRLYGRQNPYVAAEGVNAGGICQIPEEVFETVIMRYFKIDQETLRSKTTYLPQKAAYEYRPRGSYEAQYPEIPYPEVASYTINQDGTIALTVNGVYPYENTSKAYSHRTVIRLLDDGRFQYVSNEMLPSGETPDTWWRHDRLAAEEWKEHYQ